MTATTTSARASSPPEPDNARFTVVFDPDAPPDRCYLLTVPVDGGVVRLATSAPWPGDERLRCHPRPPTDRGARADLEVVDEVDVVAAVRRGPSLDLVLDRATQARSRLLVAPIELDDRGSGVDGSEDGVFWQTSASAVRVAPRQRVPTARERGVVDLTITVDTREQKPWAFDDLPVSTEVAKLDEGDYAILEDGRLIAVVERKKVGDFQSSLTRGRLSEQMAALATLPRAAVVVEGTYARALRRKRVVRHRMADLVAAVQASFPQIPVVFAGNRADAQQWTYRWLAACLSHHHDQTGRSLLDPV